MINSFTKQLSTGICMLALCLGQILITTPTLAAQTTNGTGASSPGIQGEIKSNVESAGRGLADIAHGAGSISDAAGSISGAADALNIDGLGDITGQLGTVTDTLGKGQSILNQADSILGKDLNNLLPGGDGKFDFSNMSADSILDGMGKTLGNQWDLAKGISLSGLWGGTTNFWKDLTPDIKTLMGTKLTELDFSSLATFFPAGGLPVIFADLEPLNIFTVTSTATTFASKEAQLAYEQAYTPTIGPVGTMDGRMGICTVNSHDYTGMLRSYVAGPGAKSEGNFPFLHLDTVCVLTVGIGTALHVKGSAKETQKAYFMSMDYSPKETQDADFEAMWEKRNECLAQCGGTGGNKCPSGTKVNKTENSYRQYTKGALTQGAVQDAIISELCQNVRSYDANYAKNGGNFALLPVEHQFVTVDIGYQGGPGCITGCSNCAMGSSYSAPFKSALIQKSCSSAYSAFSGSSLAKNYTNRAAERKAMIMAPCGGG